MEATLPSFIRQAQSTPNFIQHSPPIRANPHKDLCQVGDGLLSYTSLITLSPTLPGQFCIQRLLALAAQLYPTGPISRSAIRRSITPAWGYIRPYTGTPRPTGAYKLVPAPASALKVSNKALSTDRSGRKASVKRPTAADPYDYHLRVRPPRAPGCYLSRELIVAYKGQTEQSILDGGETDGSDPSDLVPYLMMGPQVQSGRRKFVEAGSKKKRGKENKSREGIS